MSYPDTVHPDDGYPDTLTVSGGGGYDDVYRRTSTVQNGRPVWKKETGPGRYFYYSGI